MREKQEIANVSIKYKNDESARAKFLDFLVHFMVENNFLRKDGVDE